MRNLRTLEQEGMVNSKNDYQEIINAIAKVSWGAYASCLDTGINHVSRFHFTYPTPLLGAWNE